MGSCLTRKCHKSHGNPVCSPQPFVCWGRGGGRQNGDPCILFPRHTESRPVQDVAWACLLARTLTFHRPGAPGWGGRADPRSGLGWGDTAPGWGTPLCLCRSLAGQVTLGRLSAPLVHTAFSKCTPLTAQLGVNSHPVGLVLARRLLIRMAVGAGADAVGRHPVGLGSPKTVGPNGLALHVMF